MPARTIAIGDIHGCDVALANLVEAIGPTSDDLIVTLGDYIDRGPNSRAVIDRLLDLGNTCRFVPLLGNHEAMLLTELEGESSNTAFWLQYGGQETLASYGGSVDDVPDEHRQFLSQCQLIYETDTHFFVHARYFSDLPLIAQPQSQLLWQALMPSPPGPHYSGKLAVVGHTAQIGGEVLDLGYLRCIDTYCYGGGWLTALDVHTGHTWQVNRAGKLRNA